MKQEYTLEKTEYDDGGEVFKMSYPGFSIEGKRPGKTVVKREVLVRTKDPRKVTEALAKEKDKRDNERIKEKVGK